jgi:hypothetical protein
MIPRFFNKGSKNNTEEVQSERQFKIIEHWARFSDYFRIKYPRKLDYCFMSLDEILNSLKKLVLLDEKTGGDYKPIVFVGHTKNLKDFKKVERILKFIKKSNLRIVTFKQILPKISA